jgi:quercetin dioxygenase-like cupin family protein
MAFHVTRAGDRAWSAADGSGLREAPLVGAEQGASHLEAALCELAAGATVGPHLHPFEESLYVLEGTGRYAVGGLEYQVGPGDYGLAPIGVPHWISAGQGPLRWLAVRAPRPPEARVAPRTVRAEPGTATPLGRPSETDPRHRLAGHFEDGDLGSYGPLLMPGYHGPNIRNISLHMLVDRLLGAQHHTLFMVEFAPRAGRGRAAKEHYHPFEEIYFYLSGSARGTLDGQEVTLAAGDLLWMSVGGTHGFVNENEEPLRFLEMQSPVPPDSDAFFFPGDWRELPTP